MIAKPDYEFVYMNEQSYGSNFFRWRARNNQEKFVYNEEKYSLGEAKIIFDKMYNHKKGKTWES
mgnify:CR=1 FL=1